MGIRNHESNSFLRKHLWNHITKYSHTESENKGSQLKGSNKYLVVKSKLSKRSRVKANGKPINTEEHGLHTRTDNVTSIDH